MVMLGHFQLSLCSIQWQKVDINVLKNIWSNVSITGRHTPLLENFVVRVRFYIYTLNQYINTIHTAQERETPIIIEIEEQQCSIKAN